MNETTLKPMLYTMGSRPKAAETLAEGKYKNYPYLIRSLGTHPCAYVGIPEGHRLYGRKYTHNALSEVSEAAHMGLTYLEKNHPIAGCWNLGWDYAHSCDYYPGIMEWGKRWTTEEILQDVYDVIDAIVKED